MHIVLVVVLGLAFGLIVLMDFWEDRCITQTRNDRNLMLEKARNLKRMGAIDDVALIKLMRTINDTSFDDHVRMRMTRRDFTTLYPSELDISDR